MIHKFLIIFVIFLLLVINCQSVNDNFLETTYTDDGSVIIRLQWNTTTAQLSSLNGFELLRVTDGTIFIERWTFNNELIECNFETVPTAVQDFLENFQSKSTCNDDFGSNTTCFSWHNSQRVTRTFETEKDISSEMSTAIHIDQLVKECGDFNENRHRPTVQQDKNELRRSKRGLLFPGTNWCGPGYSSKLYKGLGVNSGPDRCCRDHDYCKHYIAPFSWKYHLFNYRFHTVSHCKCDKRFKACLKSVDTTIANMVGKLFFNIAKTKCFTFTKEQVCQKRTWWGKCLKSKKIRKAMFKNPESY